MLHLYDRATMAHTLTLPLDPTLHRLLSERIASLGDELIDYTEFLIIEPGDTEEDIIQHVGFSPLVNPIDGKRYPGPAFEPCWDHLIDHGEWFEMIVTFGSTFAYLLLVQNVNNVGSPVALMCRLHSSSR